MKNLISILLSLFLLFFYRINSTSASERSIIGRTAPAFTLNDLDGNKVNLSDFKGKLVILDFWATWCPPCVKEIPHFVELYEEYKDKGLTVVGISVDQQGVGVVKAFNKRYKVNYPILMANTQVISAYGNIRGIPTTFVIDPEGKIRRMYVGYRDKSVFESDIKTFLPDGASEQKETEDQTNKYVEELNRIGIAGRPESDNAAPYYQKAIELYVEQSEGLMVETKIWPKDQPDQQQEMLKKWVRNNSRALEQLQLASQKKYCWLKYTEENLHTKEMTQVKKIRQLAIALQARAMLSAENGNVTSALKDIDTLYTIGLQLSAGPKLFIEKLLGIAIESFSNKAAFNILDAKMYNSDLMKTTENKLIQIALDYDEPFDIRGEKIFLQELIETDPQYRNSKQHLKNTLEYYDTITTKTPIQLKNETQSINKQNPLIQIFGATIPKVIEIEYRRKVGTQALITTLAILRYQNDKNEYPATLSELVSAGYLKELPIDPYSDKPLVYRRTQGSFILYSFGADFDDDGGQYSKWGTGEKGGDQVFWPVEKNL